MCGIFAYIGNKNNAAETILEGLKKLEYRGYDSWGIAIKKGGRIDIDKHIGKIGDAKTNLTPSNMGIGHTRWATHGGVTVQNAHPHLDCKKQIAVLHNGIIENFAELKKELISKGHRFISETDTEVASHLIEENLKNVGFTTAVREAFDKFSGMNALVIMNASSSEIIAVKNGSPLVVGFGKNEYFVASDASGIIPHTRKVLFLEDQQMAILNTGVKIISLSSGKTIKPQFSIIDWEIEEVETGKFEHFMIKEIHEQPKVIRNIASNYDSQIKLLCKIISTAKGTFFIGAGTASYACLLGAYLFSKIAKLHINTAPASEFNYLEDFLNKKSLIIAFSQSGETIDVIEPLNHAKTKGVKIGAVTNVLGSTIYRLSDYKILLGAGPEKAVASTKAYIAKISLILLLAYAIQGQEKKGKILLGKAASEIERILSDKSLKNIKKIAKILSQHEHIYTIGRGASHPTSLEAALKIKEVSYIHAEGLAGGELKHGAIALIREGTPCIVFAPLDETYEAIISNAIEIKSRGGLIIGIGPEKSDVFDYWIKVNDIGDASVIPEVVPAQLLGYYLALEKRYDPDKPRNLAKSVTVK